MIFQEKYFCYIQITDQISSSGDIEQYVSCNYVTFLSAFIEANKGNFFER